jgi:hypothetical protein
MSQYQDPPHALTSIEPIMHMHFCMVLALDSQTYEYVTRNPFWEATM